MANVNDGAFAAVDAFFGVDPSATKKEERSISRHAPPENAGGKRLGVGASRPQETGTSAATTAAGATSGRRILQVGSKKRRRNVGYGDDEDDFDVKGGVGDSSSNDEDEDEEEEHGRTAIDKGQKLKPASSSTYTRALDQLKQQKKKKLGKKERQRLAKEKLEKVDHAAPAAATEDSSAKKPHDNDNDNLSSSEKDEPASNDNAKKNKRKRRKVRSRQKNIYKDNRDVKPEHLVPGNRNYQGRPLTSATRAKLNMPVVQKSPFASDRHWAKGNWNDNNGFFDDDSLPTNNLLDAMPLAVDQVTRNEKDQDPGTVGVKEQTSSGNPPKSNKKDKTKKKSGKPKKYKNLL